MISGQFCFFMVVSGVFRDTRVSVFTEQSLSSDIFFSQSLAPACTTQKRLGSISAQLKYTDDTFGQHSSNAFRCSRGFRHVT